MSNALVKVESMSKQYRLVQVGAGGLSDDISH
jgi:hypothetical protein